MEEGWERRRDLVAFDRDAMRAGVREFAESRPIEIRGPLPGGLVNQSYRLDLGEPDERLCLRVYLRDPAAAAKEAAVLARVADEVPAPRVRHRGRLGGHPFTITTWIPGGALSALLDEGSAGPLRAAREAGAAIARLHTNAMDQMGVFDEHFVVAEPMPGVASTLRELLVPLVESGRPSERLGDLRRPLATALRARHPILEELEGRYAIVHADFKPTNVFVTDQGRLTGLLDWEFAWAGPPLIDLGQMLRWPTPDGFEDALAKGYREGGGALPDDWRMQARLLDLINLVTILDTPDDRPTITRDVSRLIEGTLRALDG